MGSSRRFIPLLAALSAVAAAALAQGTGEPPAPAPVFSDVVDVNVVNIDVYVTDRKGNPITGLGVDDFELYVDGERQEIEHFYAVGEDRSRLTGSVGRGAPPTGAPAQEREPLQIAVVLDNVNTRPGNRVRVLDQLGQVLARQLGSGDRVMLATYDRSFHIHQPFTGDAGEIAAALDRIRALPALGRELDSEREMGIRGIIASFHGGVDRGCENVTEGYAHRYIQSTTHRVHTTVEALGEFVGSLAGIPGRKALLYVSDGLQLRPGYDFHLIVANICGDPSWSLQGESYDTALAFKRLTALANSARVSFYPLDATGGTVLPGSGRLGSLRDSTLRRSLQDSLRFMAADTGGVPLLNALDVSEALQPVLEDAGGYYSLGYSAPVEGSGRVRSLEVKVDRRRVRVRSRLSFKEKTAEERIKDRLLSALWMGDAANPLGVEVEPVGEPTPTAGGHQVSLRLGVPIENLSLVAGDDVHRGRLKVFVTAQDESGARAPVSVAEVPVEVSRVDMETARGQLYGYELNLIMEEGRQRVAVGVRDELAQVTSFLVREIEVGSEPSPGS